MRNRRQTIVQAALATLREEGYSKFTQPRVAARAGIRQSLLTYYYPTRLALLEAVALTAINAQLADIDALVQQMSAKEAAVSIAGLCRQNARIVMALAQAADQEPAVRSLFGKLVDGLSIRMTRIFESNHLIASAEHVPILLALFVGQTITGLGTADMDTSRDRNVVIETMLSLPWSERTNAVRPRAKSSMQR